MPVPIVDLIDMRPEDYEVWLDADISRYELLIPMLRPYTHEEMSAYAVSTLVNNPSKNDPRCTELLRGV